MNGMVKFKCGAELPRDAARGIVADLRDLQDFQPDAFYHLVMGTRYHGWRPPSDAVAKLTELGWIEFNPPNVVKVRGDAQAVVRQVVTGGGLCLEVGDV